MLLEVNAIIKSCEHCGIDFIPNNGKQVCCSRKCNVGKWRKLNPDKNKASEKRSSEKRKGINRYNPETRKVWYKNKSKDVVWKAKINNQANLRHSRLKDYLRDYKLTQGCVDCGYNTHHVALDFDHVDGEKELNVCNAKSIAQAKKEIEKCEVVCSNCHRIRTFERINKTD